MCGMWPPLLPVLPWKTSWNLFNVLMTFPHQRPRRFRPFSMNHIRQSSSSLKPLVHLHSVPALWTESSRAEMTHGASHSPDLRAWNAEGRPIWPPTASLPQYCRGLSFLNSASHMFLTYANAFDGALFLSESPLPFFHPFTILILIQTLSFILLRFFQNIPF